MKTYSSVQKRFVDFCEKYGLLHANGSPLPAAELTIIRFIGSLSESCQASTIRVYLSAIRSLHVNCGLSDPLIGCLRIPLVVKGLRRIKSQKSPPKLPITPLILHYILGQLNLENFNDVMFWAVCCTAFFGFLRAAEVTVTPDKCVGNTYLAVSDVSVSNQSHPGAVFIKLRYSKTDQFGTGCLSDRLSAQSRH